MEEKEKSSTNLLFIHFKYIYFLSIFYIFFLICKAQPRALVIKLTGWLTYDSFESFFEIASNCTGTFVLLH